MVSRLMLLMPSQLPRLSSSRSNSNMMRLVMAVVMVMLDSRAMDNRCFIFAPTMEPLPTPLLVLKVTLLLGNVYPSIFFTFVMSCRQVGSSIANRLVGRKLRFLVSVARKPVLEHPSRELRCHRCPMLTQQQWPAMGWLLMGATCNTLAMAICQILMDILRCSVPKLYQLLCISKYLPETF